MGTIGFGEAFHALKPDLLVLLGDRFELLAAASAALVALIPIAVKCLAQGMIDLGLNNDLILREFYCFLEEKFT